MNMELSVKDLLYDLRPMRVALLLFVFLSMILKPTPGTEIIYEGWPMVSTLLMPVFSPILLMLLWLDSLIAKLWASQTEGKEHKRYKMITRIDFGLSIIYILVWFPYFKAVAE